MSLINRQWRVIIGRWLNVIAEQIRSGRNELQVRIRGKDVHIDSFVSDAVYLIEGSSCTLTWSVSNAYSVQLSEGLGHYTQLRYGVRVLSANLPERLTLTAYGRNGAVQAELFFTHLRVNHKPVNVPVYVHKGQITLRPNEFVPANPSPTPRLRLNAPLFPVQTIHFAIDDKQITTLMQSIHEAKDLNN